MTATPTCSSCKGRGLVPCPDGAGSYDAPLPCPACRPDLAVLALDLATTTGYALRARSGRVTSGVVRFELGEDEHPGARWPRVREWLTRQCSRMVSSIEVMGSMSVERLRAEPAVDLIAWERIVSWRSMRADGLLYAMQAQVVEVAHVFGVETLTVDPMTLKKWATGDRRAKKPEMLAAARARWPEQQVEGHDQADALLVLAWALETAPARGFAWPYQAVAPKAPGGDRAS